MNEDFSKNEEKIVEVEEEILRRHRTEKKELQAKIQALKKTAIKGDKKKKKEVTDTILKLEKELEDKHAEELGNINISENISVSELDNDNELNNCEDPVEEEQKPVTRLSRAQKRRNKKVSEEQEREKRIQEEEEVNKLGPRAQELSAIEEILKTEKLKIHNIPADGNCLYCAVNHQLDVTGRDSLTISKLRKLTATYMRENKDDFMPFMYTPNEEPMTEELFDKYCIDVEKSKMWGGQLEIKALSSALKCPIKIVQGNGPSALQGDNYESPPLILTYHRYLYRLGAHYNSTLPIKNDMLLETDTE